MIGKLLKKDNIWFVECLSNIGSRYECFYQNEFKPEHENQYVDYRIKSRHHGIILCADVVQYVSKERLREFKLSKLCS